MAEQEDIVNFCDITGATTEVAKNFLQISDNNVEMAISLYLESGGDLGTGTGSSSNINAGRFSSNNNSRRSSIHSIDNMLTDEEIARQLQESEQQRHEVRAPIAPRNDILAGGGGIRDMMFHPSPITSRWQRDQIGTSRPSVFNQGDSATGSVSDFLNRLNSDVPSRSLSGSPSGDSLNSPTTTTASAKSKRLADLFRPPFDIMFHGNFEEARDTAKENNKWLMINIQNQTEFACQVMNRDLWSDSFVKDIIKESFIFLQYINDTADGKRYATFYSVSGYPHLAIIDAITGERVKVWESQITPTNFMMDVTEFLEQNSSDSTSNNHRATSSSTMKRPRVAKNVSEMSEEEQLNAAIAASLNAPKSSSQSPTNMDTDIIPEEDKGKQKQRIIIDDDDDEEDDNDNKDNDDELKLEQDNDKVEEDIKAGSALDGIKAIKREETKDMANSTRIQLRLGDGSRTVRRFLKTDPVRYIFEFVKAEVPLAQSQPFELVFNRTQLIDLLDQTILEAGLSNAAVNCVFI